MNKLLTIFLFAIAGYGCSLISEKKESEEVAAFGFLEESEFNNRPITSIYIDEQNREVVGTWEGLTVSLNGRYVYVSDSLSRRSNRIKVFNGTYYAISGNGDMLISSADGLTWQTVADPGRTIYDYLVLENGRILIGSVEGVYFKDENETEFQFNEFFHPSAYLPNNIKHMIETSSGAVIFGSHDGIYRSEDHGNSWVKVSTRISKHEDDITMLFETNDGTILAGHDELLYMSYDDGESWQVFVLPDGGPSKMIADDGLEYLLLGGKIWARKEGNNRFTDLNLTEHLARRYSEDNFFIIDDFHIRGDQIIIYKDYYPNRVYTGRKNSEAKIWEDFNE